MPEQLFSPPDGLTDEQAMWRVQTQDDGTAFARLVARWETPIRRLCVRMTGDIQRGEDLAQDTFARLYERRKEYLPIGKFSTYLWRIAINLCHDELRRRNRRGETPLEDEQADHAPSAFMVMDPSPDDRLEAQERSDMVRHAVSRLPEGYRSVVILRHFENLKFREIADVLDIPEGTVKSRMAEAMTQLTKFLRPAMTGEIPCVPPPAQRIDHRLVI